MNLRVKVKRVNEDIQIPHYAKTGDSGFDLVATKNVVIKPGETVIIPTGLAFELPQNYEMQVRPRSGISRKTMLHVALGTVDSGYRGEVGVIVKNLKAPLITIPEDLSEDFEEIFTNVAQDIEEKNIEFCDPCPEGSYYIRKGDRIAQGVITPVEVAHFEEVDELSGTERGACGFGSTGVN